MAKPVFSHPIVFRAAGSGAVLRANQAVTFGVVERTLGLLVATAVITAAQAAEIQTALEQAAA
jgi:hypothetical protein